LWFAFGRRPSPAKYATASLERGDIVEIVGATGTLQAVTTVQVGSQVSGTIQSMGADFNSVVKKGQVIARLDPSLFEARLGQSRASLITARANVDRQKSVVTDTKQKYARAQQLFKEELLPESELETAAANHEGAQAQLKANEAAVSQAEANLNQAQVDLNHTIIQTPIDGVVINRAVDVGQTVAASFQAPVLFIIANDLASMQVNAAVDEADIGRVRTGQEVSFRVDAYPDRTFAGKVEQVRLQPQTIQNVVSYNTIISADNAEQKLMPGMTATVSIVVNKAENALRLPTSALRFRPEGFEETGGRPAARAAGSRGQDGAPPPAAGGTAVAAVQAASREGGRGDGATSGRGPRGSSETGPSPRDRSERDSASEGKRSLVFLLGADQKPEPTRVRTGLSDGQFVEVKDGLSEGAVVVTGLESATSRGPAGARPGASPSNNPFAPGPPPRRQR
jgi:HlyD family secretion protein